MKNNIKAIFFDYGGTLDAPGIPWRPHFYQIYKQHGIDIDYEQFSKAFFKADDSLVAENPSHLNLTDVVFEQVKRVLKELSCYEKSLQKAIANNFLINSFKNIKGAIPVLKQLKKKFFLGIISNNYGNLQEICKETGLSDIMDVLIDSNEIGAEKPDPKIFNTALKRLNLKPHEAVMVGDNIKRDIIGAKEVGLRPILIKAKNKNININPDKEPKGVLVISDIKELLEKFM